MYYGRVMHEGAPMHHVRGGEFICRKSCENLIIVARPTALDLYYNVHTATTGTASSMIAVHSAFQVLPRLQLALAFEVAITRRNLYHATTVWSKG